MKKRTQITLASIVGLFAVIGLSSCTKSFCSNIDSARAMYAFEPGITEYEIGTETLSITDGSNTYKIENYQKVVAQFDAKNSKFYFYKDSTLPAEELDQESNRRYLSYLNDIISSAKDNGILSVTATQVPYFEKVDAYVLENILSEALREKKENVTRDLSNEDDMMMFKRDVSYYSYRKYVSNDNEYIYGIYDSVDEKVRTELSEDQCVGSDFRVLYKNALSNLSSQYRTCLATYTDKYGTYGYSTEGIYVNAKSWEFAWSKGFFEGLLVYPIGWLIDQIALGFTPSVGTGVAALLSIFFVTLIVRGLMMLVTFKQTAGNAKMTELQPEITKIQNKYPNANTNKYEKQRMAEEINAVYKKNKINPLSTLLVMIVQFPVFICVWGALSGASVLTSGSVLGLNLSMAIRDAMFNQAYWTAEYNYMAVTAFILFLLMAGAQTISMLLPQWMQKAKAKKVARLGKNPSQKSQDNKMKWVTYIMLAMIIFMGFSLVSAMGVYWLIGALISIAQTLITQAVTEAKSRKKRN